MQYYIFLHLLTQLMGSECRPDLSNSPTIAKPDWETYCYKVSDMIIQEQTPQRVMEVRAKLYELLSHCIPATVILKVRRLFYPHSVSYGTFRRLRIVWYRKLTKASSPTSCTGQPSTYVNYSCRRIYLACLIPHNRKIVCVSEIKRYIIWKPG